MFSALPPTITGLPARIFSTPLGAAGFTTATALMASGCTSQEKIIGTIAGTGVALGLVGWGIIKGRANARDARRFAEEMDPYATDSDGKAGTLNPDKLSRQKRYSASPLVQSDTPWLSDGIKIGFDAPVERWISQEGGFRLKFENVSPQDWKEMKARFAKILDRALGTVCTHTPRYEIYYNPQTRRASIVSTGMQGLGTDETKLADTAIIRLKYELGIPNPLFWRIINNDASISRYPEQLLDAADAVEAEYTSPTKDYGFVKEVYRLLNEADTAIIEQDGIIACDRIEEALEVAMQHNCRRLIRITQAYLMYVNMYKLDDLERVTGWIVEE